MGISNIKFCGIGYEDSLTKIPQLSEDKKDIDVLFYGSMNERRKKVLDQLSANGLNVVVLFGKYGSERDEYIARSKIIINIHYYEAKVFEIVRTSYLLANKCFVVSEEGNDSNLEEPFVQGIAFSSYTQLVDTCMKYLKDKTAREKIAKKGFEIITSKKQSDYLKALI